ncbi:MAG: KH domain-containing protein [Candidatus Aminicenantales bacterium]
MKQISSLSALLLVGLLFSACSAPKFTNIMTWEEYLELRLQGPYVLELEHDKGALLYYGVIHTTTSDDPQLADIELKVAPEDVGKVIGKQGRNVQAIRIILGAAAMKLKRRFNLEIIEFICILPICLHFQM